MSLLSPGLQKVSRNKTVGRKTLSITQTNCIIKAIKEEKTMKNDKKDRRHRGCFCCCCLESLLAKTFMRFCVRKTLAKSLVIYKPKRFGLLSQDWCPIRDDADVYTAASVWKSKWWRRKQDKFATLPICWISPQRTYFSVRE